MLTGWAAMDQAIYGHHPPIEIDLSAAIRAQISAEAIEQHLY
jgi:hypothetical protein